MEKPFSVWGQFLETLFSAGNKIHLISAGFYSTYDSNTYFQVNGYLWTMYNFGSSDHRISDDTNRINDGAYHVIHFSRTGANASLQIDQYAKVYKTPKGKNST